MGTAPGQDLSRSLLQAGAAGVRLYKPTAGGRAEAGAATLLRAGDPRRVTPSLGNGVKAQASPEWEIHPLDSKLSLS